MKLKDTPSFLWNFGALLVCAGVIATLSPGSVSAQEKEASSTVEMSAIKSVRAAGGRVLQISAADPTREVSFYLAGKKVGDEQVSNVGSIENVIWLNLANTEVTDSGLKHIAGMKLQKLHLEKTGIGDAGLAHLKDMSDLEYLNLYGTSITDKGLKHLSKLSKLRRLYVWQSKVTETGMKALEKQIPGLKVIGECKLPVIEKPKKEKPKKDESKKDESKKDKPKKDKPKKDEPKRDESKKDEPKKDGLKKSENSDQSET